MTTTTPMPRRLGPLRRITADFTTRAWVLIPVGVGMNVALGAVVQALRLPIFLDTVGTVLVALLCGPWVAAVTGIATNLVMTAVNPVWIFFIPVQMGIGIAVGLLASTALLRTLPGRAVGGVIVTIVAVVIAGPIIVVTTGGASGTGSSAVTAFFLATGDTIWSSVLKTQFVFEPIDKILTVLAATAVVKVLPGRYRTARATRALGR